MRYRPEIDGLRGLAVLVVVLFHAELGCPGGFVGVDVFFVISGYLITSILLTRDYTLRQFWEARLRRLFPALALVVLSVLAVGPYFLAPADFSDLSGAMVAQWLMCSNLYFWSTSGYWDGPAQLKPLLHTWSLAVEEQFYLLYPVLLPLLRGRLHWLVLVTFPLSVWGVSHAPDAAFYLLPFRAWELALGAALAQVPTRAGTGPGRVGLVLILAAVLGYSSLTPFPGWAALLPCLGTALFLWSPGTLLTGRVPVALGLVSYSWYLWHWPLLAYARYAAAGPLTVSARLAVVGVSLALAYVSWRWVERPFRKRRLFPSHFGRAVAVVWIALLGAGLTSRLTPASDVPSPGFHVVTHEPDWDAMTSLEQVLRGELLPLGRTAGPVHFVLWGDSHAIVVRATVDQAARAAGRRGSAAEWEATPPLLDYINDFHLSLQGDSLAWNQGVLDYVRAHHVKHVILCARWSIHTAAPTFATALQRTLRELEEAGCTAWVLEQPPEYDQSVVRSLKRAARLGQDPDEVGITAETYRLEKAPMERLLERYRQPHTRVLDPTPYFFDGGGRARVVTGSLSLYCDADHLSAEGAGRLRPLFDEIMRGD